MTYLETGEFWDLAVDPWMPADWHSRKLTQGSSVNLPPFPEPGQTGQGAAGTANSL